MWQKQQQERFEMQIKNKNLQDTIEYLRSHMLNANEPPENAVQSEEVSPVVIRKTPKFLTRERHLAIRRRKPPATGSESPESQKSESISFAYESEESSEASEIE